MQRRRRFLDYLTLNDVRFLGLSSADLHALDRYFLLADASTQTEESILTHALDIEPDEGLRTKAAKIASRVGFDFD